MSNRAVFAVLAALFAAAVVGASVVWGFLSFRANAQREIAERERAKAQLQLEEVERERAEAQRALDERWRAARERLAALPVAPPPRAVEGGPPRLVPIDPPDPEELPGAGKPSDLKPDPNAKGRAQRWVLRFLTKDGRDYVDQLRQLKAEILFPLPPDGKEKYLFPDLTDPAKGRKATDDDLKRLAPKLQFGDERPEMAADVARALGLDAKPKTFSAFFPRELEEELARKETSYRNRRAEDIESTVFRVLVRGGKAEVVVDDQRPKR